MGWARGVQGLTSHPISYLSSCCEVRSEGWGRELARGHGLRPESSPLWATSIIKPRLKAGRSHSPRGHFLSSSPWTSEGLGLVVSPRNLVATRGMTLPGRRVFAVTRNVTDAHVAL